MDSDIFALTRGTLPLLVSIPHAGTHIPSELAQRMTPQALQRADVDWHLPQLYGFAARDRCERAGRHARAPRDRPEPPPEDESLYPGRT